MKKIDKIITENDKTYNQIDNLSQQVGIIDSRVGETSTKSDEKSREIKEKVEFIKDKISKIEMKCDNTYESVLKNSKNIDNVYQYLKIFRYLNGIINKLTNECDGNVLDKGIVNVTRSTDSWGKLRDIVSIDNTGLFGTLNRLNSWIKYDFKDKKSFSGLLLN